MTTEDLELLNVVRNGGIDWGGGYENPPNVPESKDIEDGWHPDLNPTQGKIFNSKKKFMLAYGERGTGKTIGALHKLVRHCYENRNALALIIVNVKRMAEEGGAWYKLNADILDTWKSGNKEIVDGDYTGKRLDKGIGLQFTEPKTNTAKDIFIWIRNRFGGWSRVVLLSMPVESFIGDRVKGMEPSFILIDEGQTLESDAYFKFPVQQLSRRPGIRLQQYIVCCNPDGPSHWLYKKFWEDCIDPDTGEMDPDYAKWHVPFQENQKNLNPEYIKTVMQAVKGDPIEEARMLRGEWIDRPSGEAIYKDYYEEGIHVAGSLKTGKRLCPIDGYTIQVGHDPGPANYSIHFEQLVLLDDGFLWIIFDELNFVAERRPYHYVARKLINRTKYWKQRFPGCGWEHIADEAAFNQRNSRGKFDSQEMFELTEGQVKMKPCPKGKDSVPQRVKMVMDYLGTGRILISDHCVKTKQMFMNLESKRVPKGQYDEFRGLIPKRSVHIHPFDSMSYPMFYYHFGPGKSVATNADTPKMSIFSCGQNG